VLVAACFLLAPANSGASCLDEVLTLTADDEENFFYSGVVDQVAVSAARSGARALDLMAAEAEVAEDYEIDSTTAAALVRLASCRELARIREEGPGLAGDRSLRDDLETVVRSSSSSHQLRSEIEILLDGRHYPEWPLHSFVAATLLDVDPSGRRIWDWFESLWIGGRLAQALVAEVVQAQGVTPELLALAGSRIHSVPARFALLGRALEVLSVSGRSDPAWLEYLNREYLWSLAKLGQVDALLTEYEALPLDARVRVARPAGEADGVELQVYDDFSYVFFETDADLALALAYAYLAAGHDEGLVELQSMIAAAGPECDRPEEVMPAELLASNSCRGVGAEPAAWRWLAEWRRGEVGDAYELATAVVTDHRVYHSIAWKRGGELLAAAAGFDALVDFWQRESAGWVDSWLADEDAPGLVAVDHGVQARWDGMSDLLRAEWGVPSDVTWPRGIAELILDSDGDGISDSLETAWYLDPRSADTDGDGVPDDRDPLARIAPAARCDAIDAVVASHLAGELDDPWPRSRVLVAPEDLLDCLDPSTQFAYLRPEEKRRRDLAIYSAIEIDYVILDAEGRRAYLGSPDGDREYELKEEGWKLGDLQIVLNCGVEIETVTPLPFAAALQP